MCSIKKVGVEGASNMAAGGVDEGGREGKAVSPLNRPKLPSTKSHSRSYNSIPYLRVFMCLQCHKIPCFLIFIFYIQKRVIPVNSRVFRVVVD